MDARDDRYSRDDPLDEPPEDEKSDPDKLRERISSRSPDAVADAVNALLDNPVINQALKAAFGVRDIATDASNQTLHALNVGTANDLDRLTRRLRSISDRIEALEDGLDRLEGEVGKLRREPEVETSAAPDQAALDQQLSQERLGLSE